MGVNTFVVVVAQSDRLDWQLTANLCIEGGVGGAHQAGQGELPGHEHDDIDYGAPGSTL